MLDEMTKKGNSKLDNFERPTLRGVGKVLTGLGE
jgi:hypothetical protein